MTEIYAADIDEIDHPLDNMLDQIASIAHDKGKAPEKYQDLIEALTEAFEEIEKIPGDNADSISTLKDGRRVKITRIIED